MDLLLIIRGLAAISVVAWHSVGHEAGFQLLSIPGRIAVWIFFGISGYVISYGFIHQRYLLNQTGLRSFYWNRFLRIYPMFFLMSLFGWLTIWMLTGKNPLRIGDLWGQFFTLQFNHAYELNGVFWTLGLEIQFYVIAPVMAMLFFIKNHVFKWTIIFTFYSLLIWFNYLAVNFLGWSVDGRNIIAVLPHFFIGMIGCGLVSSLKHSNTKGALYLTGALSCLLTGSWLYHRRPEWFWGVYGTVLIDAVILFAIFAHASLHQHNQSGPRLTKVLEGIGLLSYGIYLWHSYFLSHMAVFTDRALLLLFASIIMAYLSYKMVELPLLKLKRG